MQANATLRFLRIAPRKVRLVADMIRGKPVQDAINALRFTRKSASLPLRKLIESAVANAENNHGLDIDDLVVAEAWVGKNMVMKRGRPRARGRFGRILKPFSQITIKVRQVEEQL